MQVGERMPRRSTDRRVHRMRRRIGTRDVRGNARNIRLRLLERDARFAPGVREIDALVIGLCPFPVGSRAIQISNGSAAVVSEDRKLEIRRASRR